MEQPNFEIKKAYEENLYTNPSFEEKNGDYAEDNPDFTALDTFAIPAELLESKEKFLEWFEPRFFSLSKEGTGINQDGLKNFSKDLQDATDFLKKNPHILSPRINKEFSLSKNTENRVNTGFENIEDVMAFFKKVAVENTPKKNKGVPLSE